jgi:hypothetical protein
MIKSYWSQNFLLLAIVNIQDDPLIVIENVLEKQSLIADKGWSPAWGLDGGLNAPHHKYPPPYEILCSFSELTSGGLL